MSVVKTVHDSAEQYRDKKQRGRQTIAKYCMRNVKMVIYKTLKCSTEIKREVPLEKEQYFRPFHQILTKL